MISNAFPSHFSLIYSFNFVFRSMLKNQRYRQKKGCTKFFTCKNFFFCSSGSVTLQVLTATLCVASLLLDRRLAIKGGLISKSFSPWSFPHPNVPNHYFNFSKLIPLASHQTIANMYTEFEFFIWNIK